jgi:hypothetical protein
VAAVRLILCTARAIRGVITAEAQREQNQKRRLYRRRFYFQSGPPQYRSTAPSNMLMRPSPHIGQQKPRKAGRQPARAAAIVSRRTRFDGCARLRAQKGEIFAELGLINEFAGQRGLMRRHELWIGQDKAKALQLFEHVEQQQTSALGADRRWIKIVSKRNAVVGPAQVFPSGVHPREFARERVRQWKRIARLRHGASLFASGTGGWTRTTDLWFHRPAL